METNAEKYVAFARKVKEMRDAQKEYRKAKKAKLYSQAEKWQHAVNALEIEVDYIVKQILTPQAQLFTPP